MIDGEKTPRAVSATACARGKVRPTQQGERRLGCVTEGTAGKPPAPARARESEAAKYGDLGARSGEPIGPRPGFVMPQREAAAAHAQDMVTVRSVKLHLWAMGIFMTATVRTRRTGSACHRPLPASPASAALGSSSNAQARAAQEAGGSRNTGRQRGAALYTPSGLTAAHAMERGECPAL